MEGGEPEDKYGIDHVETPEDVMGVDLGNGLKSKIRSSEDNPQKPLDKGEAGNDGDILNAGEKNQQSDKDENSKEGASWANRTGEKAKLTAAAATGNVGKLAKEVKKNGGIRGTAKVVGPIGTILIIIAFCIGGFLGSQSTMLGSLVGNLQGSFDPIDIAAAVRSKVLIKSIMSGNNTKGGLWSKFSDRMKAKFKNANIEVETNGDTVSSYQTINILKTIYFILRRKKMSFYFCIVLNISSKQFVLMSGNRNRFEQIVYSWIMLPKGSAIRHPIKWYASIVQIKIRQSATLLTPVLPFNDSVVHLMEQVS